LAPTLLHATRNQPRPGAESCSFPFVAHEKKLCKKTQFIRSFHRLLFFGVGEKEQNAILLLPPVDSRAPGKNMEGQKKTKKKTIRLGRG